MASLADFKDIDVIGETGNIEEVSTLYAKLKPDVVVLDIMFGGKKTGLCAIKSLLEIDSQVKVVILSQFDQDALVREAYKSGAMAFITKDANVEQLVNAIRKATVGKRYYLPQLAERLADMATRMESSPFEQLSHRELDVLVLTGEGKTTQDIAAELGISTRTVVSITQSLRTIFGVERRGDLIPIGQRYSAQRSL